MTDWDDLAPDQRPDYSQVAGHAAPGAPALNLPEVADPVAESLNAGAGKGETPFCRPRTFVSAYRQVFDQHRGVFGSQALLKSPETPRASKKHLTSSDESQSVRQRDTKHTGATAQSTNHEMVRITDNSPKTPPRKKAQFGDCKKCKLSDDSGLKAVNIKRHKSFNEENSRYSDQPAVCSIKPSDTLKTPFLLPTNTQHNSFNNFPQINSTSMVAKTKALFEEKDRTEFVPLGKSRTFSSFPTSSEAETPHFSFPLTPSVPLRNSSRRVFETYKSMNSNMNSCGMEVTSPMEDRRIPMRKFF